MRNLFQSGAVFLILAGISFMVAAITGVTYFVTGNGSVAVPVTLAASAMGCLVIGMAIRKKNAK